jgi:F0F1-type ATP synthase alpha subunit
MKYAVEMGSGAMIYIPSFIKIGSGIQKLILGNSQTDKRARARSTVISKAYFYVFKIRKVGQIQASNMFHICYVNA